MSASLVVVALVIFPLVTPQLVDVPFVKDAENADKRDENQPFVEVLLVDTKLVEVALVALMLVKAKLDAKKLVAVALVNAPLVVKKLVEVLLVNTVLEALSVPENDNVFTADL